MVVESFSHGQLCRTEIQDPHTHYACFTTLEPGLVHLASLSWHKDYQSSSLRTSQTDLPLSGQGRGLKFMRQLTFGGNMAFACMVIFPGVFTQRRITVSTYPLSTCTISKVPTNHASAICHPSTTFASAAMPITCDNFAIRLIEDQYTAPAQPVEAVAVSHIGLALPT